MISYSSQVFTIVELALGLKVLKIQELDSGNDSKVFKLDLESGSVVILKIPHQPSPEIKLKYAVEADVYKKLESLDAMVPRLLHFGDGFLLISCIEGSMLDDQESLYSNKVIFLEAAKDLRKIHSVKYQGFGKAAPDKYQTTGEIAGEYASFREFLNVFYSTHYKVLDTLDNSQKDIVEKFWKDNIVLADDVQSTLLHGDFSMSHIFVKEGQYSGIIDLGDAFFGDPLMDLAYFKFKEINKGYGEIVFQNLCGGYFSQNLMETSETNKKLLLYMLYWGMERMSSVEDMQIKSKFADKLRCVIKLIAENNLQ